MLHRTRFSSAKMLLLLCAAGLAVSMALTACRTNTSERDISFVNPEQGARLVEGGGGGLRLGGKRTVVWVDPRTADEYASGHIPGAINLPYQDLLAREEELRNYDVVIVYGSDYNDPKSHGMSKRLLELGHDARTLRGGLRAWVDAGRELETD